MAKRKTDVVKPNSIAEARGMLSKAYLDILDISLHLISNGETDPKRLEYDIKVSEYADKLQMKHSDNAFRLFKNYRTEIRNSNRSVTMDINGVDTDVWIFQDIGYDNGNGIVKVTFTTKFKEYLVKKLEERGKKICYCITETLPMKSEYAKRFYPILLERVHEKENDRMKFSAIGSLNGIELDRIDTIDGFRELLSIPESYGTKNIKDICNTIIKEIETYTPFEAKVHYNEVKGNKGRYPKITHICWTMESKKPIEEKITHLMDYMKMKGVTTSEKEAKIIYKIAEENGISFEEMKERIEYVLKMKDVKNTIAYIVSMMKLENFKDCSKEDPTKIHLEKFGFEAREYDFADLESKLLDY